MSRFLKNSIYLTHLLYTLSLMIIN